MTTPETYAARVNKLLDQLDVPLVKLHVYPEDVTVAGEQVVMSMSVLDARLRLEVSCSTLELVLALLEEVQ